MPQQRQPGMQPGQQQPNVTPQQQRPTPAPTPQMPQGQPGLNPQILHMMQQAWELVRPRQDTYGSYLQSGAFYDLLDLEDRVVARKYVLMVAVSRDGDTGLFTGLDQG